MQVLTTVSRFLDEEHRQIAIPVSSPYASTTLAVWDVRDTSHGGVAENQGACVLSSTLLGQGRARAALDLGGGEELQPCSPQWWSAGSARALQPRLGLAGIPRSPG
jgi:hypothetical protein